MAVNNYCPFLAQCNSNITVKINKVVVAWASVFNSMQRQVAITNAGNLTVFCGFVFVQVRTKTNPRQPAVAAGVRRYSMRIDLFLSLLIFSLSSGVYGKTMLCGNLDNKSITVKQYDTENGKEVEVHFPDEIEGFKFIGVSVIYGNNSEFSTEARTLTGDTLNHVAYADVATNHGPIKFKGSYSLGSCFKHSTVIVGGSNNGA